MRGRFFDYWQAHGGLAQQGLPLSDEFDEVNPTDGKTYRVQYFERARFEYHPENQAPYDVLLGLLGREQLLNKSSGGAAADPSWGPTLPPLVGGKAYTDSQGRFSVSVPQDWNGQTEPSLDVRFSQSDRNLVAFFTYSELSSGATLEDARITYAGEIAKTSGGTILRLDKLVVAGERAYRYVYTIDNNGQQLIVETIIFTSGTKAHFLAFVADAANIARLSVTFDGVAGSYVIGPSGR